DAADVLGDVERAGEVAAAVIEAGNRGGLGIAQPRQVVLVIDRAEIDQRRRERTAEAGDEVDGADEAAVEVLRDRDTARRTRSGPVAGIGLPEVVRERVGAAEVEGVVEIAS